MAKQIKLGFDKGTSRSRSSDQPLVDVRGNLLRDSYGELLFTETDAIPTSFFASRNATSVHINNQPTAETRQGGSIAIQEQFAETSQVSSSLLGIPRAERQQTLLADVSIYGLDENTWEFYRSPNPFQPAEWATRVNKTYGRRYNPRLGEHPEEQALALELFPTPFNFPFGPKWESQGRYNELAFTAYRRFIQLGNALYEYYASRNQKVFAEQHFLIPEMAVIDGNDVIYNENFDLALQYVEQWTMTWMDIRDIRLEDPLNSGRRLTGAVINNIFAPVFGFEFGETQPGYSSTSYRYCQLQSKEAFRYQPGAISGFTFGIKLNADPAAAVNVIEWGCANDTDQLMFQVRGSQFNIVRRSTVPLGRKNLELNGFNLTDETEIDAPNPFERGDNRFNTSDFGLPPEEKPKLNELIIQSDNFNGDPLDGSGPSGYNISFNEVTMYKIEYSWYGAIGAKFYAYIPVGNAEARWVLLHTLVIENTLDKPSLQNPFMHFRYAVYMNDTSSLREPMFLYKYGASYYIDGDDEGSFTYNSYKLQSQKSITSVNSIPLMGFIPKNRILNRDSIGTANQKNFFIETISGSSDKNARIDILECEGCPGGHGHFYATSLQNGQSGITDTFRITQQGDLVFVDDAGGTKIFTEQDDGKKIIGPGVFSSYVFSKEEDAMTIRRRLGSSRVNTPIDNETYNTDDQISIGGELISLLGYEFTGRLTGYDDIIASTTPITKSNVKVQFLNPIGREATGQWAEFRIGITNKKPELIVPEEETEEKLLFDGDELNLENEIFAEFAQFQARKNLQGVETGEWDPRAGNTMEQDFRIRVPRGASSGLCSEITFQISDVEIFNVEYSTTDPSGTFAGSHFVIFTNRPEIEDIKDGGIGVFDGNRFIDSGVIFEENYVSFQNQQDGSTNYVAPISGDISAFNIDQTNIAIKRINAVGRFINASKVFPFSANEYYLFIAMRDNARINNIVVKEFDEVSSFSHTPTWIKDDTCNIQEVQVQNPNAPASVMDKISDTEYLGRDGQFYMGGITFTGNVPANFVEKTRLSSVQFDDQLSLPLRPSSLKTSVYLGANKTETIKMNHIFDVDRFKLTKGSFNNKYLHLSSIVTDAGETGTVQINISGREQ